MADYTDNSYPNVGQDLVYERGDGAVVRMSITPPTDRKQPPALCSTPNRVKSRASVVLPAAVARAMLNPAVGATVRSAAEVVDRPKTKGTVTAVSPGVFDTPAVGGKMTAFILFYGGEEYFDLHQRCLESFLSTTPRGRIDLRVGSNQLNSKSVAMIEDYVRQGVITKHYRHTDNAYKYPVMREMFFDPSLPIKTKWVLWFDDDSICDADTNWFQLLAMHIQRHHRADSKEAHMVGAIYNYHLNDTHKKIFQSRPWYSGKPWRNARNMPVPNGSKACFVVGGFWAATHELIVAADIPDLGTGLTHNGGDWQIGEQVYQAGYGMCQFNGKKQFVRTSSVPRRGVTMPTIDAVSRGVAAASVQPAKGVTSNRPTSILPPLPKLRVT